MITSVRFLLGLCVLAAVPFAAMAITQEEAEQAGEEVPMQQGVQEPEADDVVPNPDSDTNDTIGDELLPSSPATTTPDTAIAPRPAPPDDKGSTDFNIAMLQGLNKVTARAQDLEAPIGSVTRFGTIEIVVHKCWKSAPTDRPENAALLEVSELKQNEAPQRIFSGWMFSSTPGISSLEHPFYDITVVECKKTELKP